MTIKKDSNNPKGSEWRKWDLQVQTIIDEGYISVSEYWDELKKESPVQCEDLVNIVGNENLIKKYDSREYFFTDQTDDEKTRATNYARLFLNYLDIFVSCPGVVCVTDHNYDHNYLIDCLYKESEKTNTKVIPGVEANVQGVHMLILFGKIPYEKTTYSEGIKTFLGTLNVHNRKSGEVLTVSNKSYSEVISEVKKIGAVCIYPHCNSDNGLFQERGKTDRTQLSDQFNCLDLNILQSKNKESADKTTCFISSKPNLKSKFVFTLGSDARSLRDTLMPDQQGNYCWIKADQTFEGLKQIIYEPEDRTFIGKEPPILVRVNGNKTKYINTLSVDKKSGYDGKHGTWFQGVKIEFNKELVAIIGNKGSGKSALSDMIGVLGHTHNAGEKQENLTFLNGKKLKFKKRGYAENFEAELIWEDQSGKGVRVSLCRDVDTNETEKVKYLPQNYFESLTNELDGSGFERTLKSVIFLHIPEEERLSLSSFEELERKKIKNIETDLVGLREELHLISKKIIELEVRQHPDNKRKLINLISEKKKELAEHQKIKPAEVKDPSKEKGVKKSTEKEKQLTQLQKLNEEYGKLSEIIAEKKKELNLLTLEKEDLIQIQSDVLRMETQVLNYKKQNKARFEKHGLDIDKIAGVVFDKSPLNAKIEEKIRKISELNNALVVKESVDSDPFAEQIEKEAAYKASYSIQRDLLQAKIDKIKNALSKPERDFQGYKEELREWESRKKEIEGTAKVPGTLNFYKGEQRYIDERLVSELEKNIEKRAQKAGEIFEKKKEVINLYNSFKKSIDKQISKDREFIGKFEMEIDADFKLSPDFSSAFLGYINKSKSGTFRGAEEKQIKEFFTEKDLLKKKDVLKILETITHYLREDQRPEVKEVGKKREISDQIDKMQEFYDFIFSLEYLKPIYELKLDGKILDELSPGEKGALLLVFYLMIDKEDIPLIIDQPEDNLDNKSVFQVLTHFIKNAKKRRQIIIVTHNPNLAVGADAEQIIYVELDKKRKYKFNYEVGSIENPRINKRIVEILEGTMPAFDKRKLKYLKEG